jgi:hypothetical protein
LSKLSAEEQKERKRRVAAATNKFCLYGSEPGVIPKASSIKASRSKLAGGASPSVIQKKCPAMGGAKGAPKKKSVKAHVEEASNIAGGPRDDQVKKKKPKKKAGVFEPLDRGSGEAVAIVLPLVTECPLVVACPLAADIR